MEFSGGLYQFANSIESQQRAFDQTQQSMQNAEARRQREIERLSKHEAREAEREQALEDISMLKADIEWLKSEVQRLNALVVEQGIRMGWQDRPQQQAGPLNYDPTPLPSYMPSPGLQDFVNGIGGI